MELRDIIVILGLVAIGVIIWDGVRRMKATRPVKKPKHEEPYIDPEEAARQAQIARELPNGGARIREMTDNEKEDLKSRLNLRERVPMLMERVDVEPPNDEVVADEEETQAQSELDFSAVMDEVSEPEPEQNSFVDDLESMQSDRSEEFEESAAAPEPDLEPAVQAEPLDKTADVLEVEAVETTPNRASESAEVVDPGPVEDLVVVHVMARSNEEFSGTSVLDLLLTAGLRHGPMDIFHYRNPKGITEFSLANCVHPGTFDPDAMNQVNTPGVTLFMQLPTAADAMEAFDHMLEMARFLAKHLEGDMLDEDHSSVTGQRIEYYREKIRSFERSKLIPS